MLNYMNSSAAAWSVVVAAQMALAGCAGSSAVPVCRDSQLLGYSPAVDEQHAHRKFRLPSITYPHEFDKNEMSGFTLRVKVDGNGSVACYRMEGRYGDEVALNERRRDLLAELRQWRYEPFFKDGTAAVALIREEIREEEAPEAHRPLPEVPLEQVHIGLERTGCFGSCPSYKVDVYGNGRVVYNGGGYVDAVGEHVYRIPPESVAHLVDSMRSKDIWSLRKEYRAPISDNPTFLLTLRLGEQAHHLEDYVGRMVGMPQTVSDFEDEIDKVSGAEGLVNLSRAAVDRLKAQGFDFRSQAGADLLARAVSNEESLDNEAMLRLIELGAPIVGTPSADNSFSDPPRPLLEKALVNQRTVLIDALIQRGALETGGTPDSRKIDEAFRAAVIGGRLESIKKIWAIAGAGLHPSLMFEDVSEDNQSVKKVVPVTLLLRPSINDANTWEGLAVSKWLAAQGCDLKASRADGTTLLHIAAAGGDAPLVRYLLNQGLDASAPGRYALPALGSTHNEDVALLLLEAGTDLSKMNDSGDSFRRFAEEMQWNRVIAWLDAH